MTVNDILWAGGTVDAPDEGPKSELVVKVVLPVLSSAEQEYGQALSRISLDDMVRAALGREDADARYITVWPGHRVHQS